MTAIITDKLKKQMLLSIINDVDSADNNYFIGIGKSEAWNATDAAPTPKNSLRDERNLGLSLQSVKAIADKSLVVPRTDWSSGAIYSSYNDNIEGHPATSYYVFTDENHLYICLQQGRNAAGNAVNSTVKPTGTSGNAFKTADGYVWKFLYSIGALTAAKFLSSNFLPVTFIETTDLPGKTAAFKSNWFGANPPAGLRIGNYTGSGVGLGSGGDQVNIYNATSNIPEASVLFGTSPTTTFATFDNTAGFNTTTTAVSSLSAVGVNGAFVAVNSATEIGSPGVYLISNPNLNTVDSSLYSNEIKLVAYPNPTNSNFQLNLINGTEEKVAIKIYDMMGRLLEFHTVNSIELNNQKLGNNFPSGIYNVVVNQGEVSKSVRVIKR